MENDGITSRNSKGAVGVCEKGMQSKQKIPTQEAIYSSKMRAMAVHGL
jgi:hypothetical protein